MAKADFLRIEWFRQMLPGMIGVLNEAFEEDDETDARNGFEVFETLLIVVQFYIQLALIYQGGLLDI